MRLGDQMVLLKNKQLELEKTKITPFFNYLKINTIYWALTGLLSIFGYSTPAKAMVLVGGAVSGALGIMLCDDLFITRDHRGRSVWCLYKELGRKIKKFQQVASQTF